MDLDKLPIPAWDLLPNERYWEIGRPHGGYFEDDEDQNTFISNYQRGLEKGKTPTHIDDFPLVSTLLH